MKYLLDTNMLIYYLEDREPAAIFIERHKKECAISLINYYEVLNYDMTVSHEETIRGFLESFEILPLTKHIVEQALQNRKQKKIKMADNFILSTAQAHDLKIVTNNGKDFERFITCINPFNDTV